MPSSATRRTRRSAPPLPPEPVPSADFVPLTVLFRTWLLLGLQSFGGGSATLYLIRRAIVEQRGWITPDDFTRNWAICQIAPGINILGLTILIGYKVRGSAGAALSLLGLLLPSVSITIAMTALYATIRGLDIVQAALRGIVPAAAGLGTLTAFQLLQPLLTASRRESYASVAFTLALLLSAAALGFMNRLPIVAVLFGAGAVAAVVYWGAGWKPRLAAERPR